MKKVIFLTYDGYRLPTARVRCYNFAHELERRGVRTEVISYVDHLNGKYDGDQRHRLSDTGRIILNIKALFRLFKEKDYIIYLQKAHYHFIAPFILNYLNDIKFILDYDDYQFYNTYFQNLGIYPFLKPKYLTCLLAEKSSAVVAASRYLQRILLKTNKNVFYIPTGVDTHIFSLRNKKKYRKKEEKRLIFSWAGIIWSEQVLNNVLSLIECFARIKNLKGAKLEIVGGGVLMEALGKIIERHPLKNSIEVVGWIEPDKMPDYLASIDVGLLPLQKNSFDKSKSPTKFFEYMAMGKTVIASKVGEVNYIVRNGGERFSLYG